MEGGRAVELPVVTGGPANEGDVLEQRQQLTQHAGRVDADSVAEEEGELGAIQASGTTGGIQGGSCGALGVGAGPRGGACAEADPVALEGEDRDPVLGVSVAAREAAIGGASDNGYTLVFSVDAGQEHGVVVGDAAQDDEGVRGLPVELLRDGATDRCGL